MTGSLVQELIRRVRESEDAGKRREALIELGYETDPSVYPVLVERLNDAAGGIVQAAVLSLARHGNTKAVGEIIKPKIMRSADPNVRWAAVKALGQLGDFRVIRRLLSAIDDPEWIVRAQAVTEIMGKVRTLIRLEDARSIRALVPLLGLDNDETVGLAQNAFFELGGLSIPVLVGALAHSSPGIRTQEARCLGRMKADQAVEPLIRLLQDRDALVRSGAIEALGQIGDVRALDPLVLCLRDNVENVQKQAVKALTNFGSSCLKPLLDTLPFETEKFAIRAIVLTLGKIRDERSIPALRNLLRSAYFVIRSAAAEALIRFGSSMVPELFPDLSYNRSDIRRLMADASAADDPVRRTRALQALGGLEDVRALPMLHAALEDPSSEVQAAAEKSIMHVSSGVWARCGALSVLGEVADPSVTPGLAISLSDPSADVRLEAVRALGKIGGNKAVDPLVQTARRDGDAFIRFEAVRTLRRIGVGHPNVLTLALKSLHDPDRDVRAQAAGLLGNFHHDRSIQPLLEATADSHWSVRQSAENALTNFGLKAVGPLIRALNSRSWTTRFRAARLLGQIGDRKAVKPLEALLARRQERKKVRDIASASLEKLTAESASSHHRP
jgi:HEAT repeat protein